MPQKQKKRRKLWLNDGSCLRLRPEYKGHVYSYDMVHDRTSDGISFQNIKYALMSILGNVYAVLQQDIYAGKMYRNNVTNIFIQYGTPEYLRSDNGSEFTANNLREWLNNLEINTTYIEPGSPWENGYVESFNGRMRDELFKR